MAARVGGLYLIKEEVGSKPIWLELFGTPELVASWALS